jgi:hypothetical protein
MKYTDKLKDPRWQKKRLEIFSRDNFTCQCCNSTENTLVVHHFKYSGEPWDIDSKHLLTLCEECHQGEHKFRPDEENELINTYKEKSYTIDHINWIKVLINGTTLTADQVVFIMINTLSNSNYSKDIFDKILSDQKDFWNNKEYGGPFIDRIYKNKK